MARGLAAPDVRILERHLDLRPLRGRRRGLVRCLFHHPDRRGSLSIDLDRQLFHCFTCGAAGGFKKFGELVGERNSGGAPTTISRTRPELEDRRHGVAMWPLADGIRQRSRAARSLLVLGTQLGADHLATWPLLSHAARLEGDGHIAEGALEDILAQGRLP